MSFCESYSKIMRKTNHITNQVQSITCCFSSPHAPDTHVSMKKNSKIFAVKNVGGGGGLQQPPVLRFSYFFFCHNNDNVPQILET